MQKKLLLLLIGAALALLLAPLTQAADLAPSPTITREELATLKGYDVEELNTKLPLIDGQIIRVKFNFRSAEVDKQADGSLQGTLRLDRYRNRQWEYGRVPATIPPAGVPWFMKITTQYGAQKLWIALARVNGGRLELLGREVVTDSRGSTIIW